MLLCFLMRNLLHVIYESVIIKRFCPFIMFMAFLFTHTATTTCMCRDIFSEGSREHDYMFSGGGWAGGRGRGGGG